MILVHKTADKLHPLYVYRKFATSIQSKISGLFILLLRGARLGHVSRSIFDTLTEAVQRSIDIARRPPPLLPLQLRQPLSRRTDAKVLSILRFGRERERERENVDITRARSLLSLPSPPERTKKCHSTQMFLRAIKLMDGTEWTDRLSAFSLGLHTFRRVYQMRAEKRAVKTHVCTFGLLDSERGYAEISAQVFSESILLSSPLMTPILTTNRATMRYIRAAVKSRQTFVFGGTIQLLRLWYERADQGTDKAFPRGAAWHASITIFRVL